MIDFQLNDYIGVLGATLLLLSYFMVTTKRWLTHTLKYQLSNLAAAALLIIYSFNKTAYVHVVINLVWGVVAITGIVLIGRHRKEWGNRPRK